MANIQGDIRQDVQIYVSFPSGLTATSPVQGRSFWNVSRLSQSNFLWNSKIVQIFRWKDKKQKFI